MQKERRGFVEFSSILIAGLLFVAVLVFVIFAVGTYRSAVRSQQDNDEKRALLGYIDTAVSTNRASRVTLEPMGETEALVICDPVTGLEQRIFYRDGKLLETYGLQGVSASEDLATEIGETADFSMAFVSPSLLEVRTDAGVSYIHIGQQE